MVGKMEPTSLSCRQYVALEHGTCLHSCRVGDISSRCFTLLPWVWVISFDLSSVHCLVTMTFDPLMSNTAKSTVVPSICSREVGLCKYQPSSDSHMILIHNKTSCSSVSCRWCGKHYGPPSIKVTSCRLQLIIQEADLETPFWYLGACMPQWQVLRIRRKVFIIGLRSNDSTSVRLKLILFTLARLYCEF